MMAYGELFFVRDGYLVVEQTLTGPRDHLFYVPLEYQLFHEDGRPVDWSGLREIRGTRTGNIIVVGNPNTDTNLEEFHIASDATSESKDFARGFQAALADRTWHKEGQGKKHYANSRHWWDGYNEGHRAKRSTAQESSNMKTREQRSVRAPRMDSFTQQYFETALWSSNDNSDDSGGEPLDTNYSISDIDPATRDRMIEDCADFQKDFGHLIDEGGGDYGQAGHDFWLTRNGHGAGFWDGDWPEPQAEGLTEASKDFGEYNLYVGDDGVIYGDTSGGYRYNPGYDPSTRKAPSTAREAAGHHVADFNTLDDLIRHARDELGATHVEPEHDTYGTRLYFPRKDGQYEVANTWQKAGYWHATGPGSREIVRHLPRGAQAIAGRTGRQAPGRRRGEVRDYEAIDRRDRVIAGPFKSYGDAKDAAGSAGAVRFVPSKGRRAPVAREPSRSAHHPTTRRR